MEDARLEMLISAPGVVQQPAYLNPYVEFTELEPKGEALSNRRWNAIYLQHGSAGGRGGRCALGSAGAVTDAA